MTTVIVVIGFGVVATSLLLLAYQGYRASPLSRYPSFPRFARLSDLPYILLDIFHPRGLTHSIEEAHKHLGPIIRIEFNRLHRFKASNRIIKIGKTEEISFLVDFGGHQSLFSVRDKHKHLARRLLKGFTTDTVEAKKKSKKKKLNKIKNHVSYVIELIIQK